jgi:hypothetical protein
VRIDRRQTDAFGAMAKMAAERADGDTYWFPVGIVGQSGTKRALWSELSRRVTPKPNQTSEFRL